MDDTELMALCRAARHYDMPIDDETEPVLLRSSPYAIFLFDARLRALGTELAKPFQRLADRISRLIG